MSGVFFAPYELVPEKESANRRLAETLRQAGIPVVLLDRDLQSFPARSDFDLVGIDNMAGGYLLAEHLIKLGCRHINFVARPNSAPTVDARIAGVREALVRHKLEGDPRWLRIGDPADVKFVRTLTAGEPGGRVHLRQRSHGDAAHALARTPRRQSPARRARRGL